MTSGALKRNKLIVSLAIADLATIVIVVVLAFVAQQQSQLVADLTEQADALSQKQSSLDRLKSSSADNQKIINALFLNDKTKAALIGELEELGAVAGVNYTLNNAEDKDGLKYDVTVKGSFTDVYQFISLVENLPYEATLETVNVEKMPNPKGGEAGLWSANLVIRVANLNATVKS